MFALHHGQEARLSEVRRLLGASEQAAKKPHQTKCIAAVQLHEGSFAPCTKRDIRSSSERASPTGVAPVASFFLSLIAAGGQRESFKILDPAVCFEFEAGRPFIENSPLLSGATGVRDAEDFGPVERV